MTRAIWLRRLSSKMRPVALLLFDSLAATCALLAAMLVRFDGQLPMAWRSALLSAIPALLASRLLIFLPARLHCWSFFMSGLSEALRLVLAMFMGSLVFAVAMMGVVPGGLPRSVLALEFFFATTLVAGARFGPRVAWIWWGELVRHRMGAARTLIVGAGAAAEMLGRDLCRSWTSPYSLIGFVDEQPRTRGMRLAGKPVLGELRELPELIRRQRITTVLLAIPHFSAASIREVLGMCDRSRVQFKIIPGSLLYIDKRISAAMLHDLSPTDLLPRDQVAFDEAELRSLVQGRCALVTGAGGSIGSEVSRQLARYGARRLIMVDLNENELYLRSRELADEWPKVEIHVAVADIREPKPLSRLGERHRPEYVLHAAAHKHVPLMETAPDEAVKNNIFGTLNAATMANDCGAERFVLISTDKAVNPTSVMGVSKRVAEMVVNDLARCSKTRMTSVRFGNVLGSAGSVVPLFRQQIARGGPVTVTHPECTRYFMTIPEAVGLVLLAGLGEYGELCVLEMGEPIRIDALARSFITLSGHIPDREIPIVYTGLRAGEKLHEELLTEQEEHTVTVRNRIRVARNHAPPRDFAAQLLALRQLAEDGDREGVVRLLHQLVPTYQGAPSVASRTERRERVVARASIALPG